jgi:hypothetical protein
MCSRFSSVFNRKAFSFLLLTLCLPAAEVLSQAQTRQSDQVAVGVMDLGVYNEVVALPPPSQKNQKFCTLFQLAPNLQPGRMSQLRKKEWQFFAIQGCSWIPE